MTGLCAIQKVYGRGRGNRTIITGYRARVGDHFTDPERTPTLAHEAGIGFAHKALNGSYTPVILQLRGWMSLVYRRPEGWFVTPPREQDTLQYRMTELDRYGHGIYATREEAELSARHHLAQTAYTDALTLEECEKLVAYTGSRARETASWIAWQRGYAHLRSLGRTDSEAREDAEQIGKSFLVVLLHEPGPDSTGASVDCDDEQCVCGHYFASHDDDVAGCEYLGLCAECDGDTTA